MKRLLPCLALLLLVATCILTLIGCSDKISTSDVSDVVKTLMREGGAFSLEHDNEYGIQHIELTGVKGSQFFTIRFFDNTTDAETYYNRDNRNDAILDDRMVYYGDSDIIATILKNSSGSAKKHTPEYDALKLIDKKYDEVKSGILTVGINFVSAETEKRGDKEEFIEIYYFTSEAAAEAFYNSKANTWAAEARDEDDNASSIEYYRDGYTVYYGTKNTISVVD